MHVNPQKTIMIFIFLILFAGISVFAYMGIYNRYWADDWCYNADFRELGFIETLKGYTYITTYASNRYSLTLFSGILYFLGVLGAQIMSPVNIVILTISLYGCMINIKKIAYISIPNMALVIFAFITIYYTIYLAPHLYQSVYWRSGSLPYFEPVVIGVLIFALITYQGTRHKPSMLLTTIVFLLAFLAGGFSEAGCATLITALTLYIGFAWFFKNQPWANNSFVTAVIALCSSLSAMIVLISSPTTAHRIALYGNQANFIDLPFLIIRFSFDFVKFSFMDLPLPHIAITGLSFLLGYTLYSPNEYKLQTRTTLIVILIILMVAFAIIASSFAPSAYIEKTPPHPRTRIIPRFVLTLGLVFIGWILGGLTRKIIQLKQFYWLVVLGTMIVGLYTLRSVFFTSLNIPVYSERAVAWDKREEKIKAAIADGEDTIYITAIDGLPVGGIRDFDTKGHGKPGYWINVCAARFYNVTAIDLKTP